MKTLICDLSTFDLTIFTAEMRRQNSIKNIAATSSFRIVLICFMIAGSQRVYGQIFADRLPAGMSTRIYQDIPENVLPYFNFIEEPSSNTIAKNMKVRLGPDFQITNWKNLHSKYKTWFIKVRSPGAASIACILSEIHLLEGESLYVYNLNSILGPFDYQSGKKLPLPYLEGDELVIEFDTPLTATEHGSFIIDGISHGVLMHDKNKSNLKHECDVCITDSLLEQLGRSVVKITVHGENFSRVCTGTLMNNTSHDGTPYVLTGQHCIGSSEDAENAVFTFRYQNLHCNTSEMEDYVSLPGSSLVAKRYATDFALVLLHDKPPLHSHPYYAGWNVVNHKMSSAFTIHHPRGRAKSLAIRQGGVATSDYPDAPDREANGFLRISEWNSGATEGGSSGAGLFNSQRQLVGTLVGGSSTCGAPYNDYFQRLEKSWSPSPDPTEQLSIWLDPILSHQTELDGLDPFHNIITSCDTLSPLSDDGQARLENYSGGVLTGTNDTKIEAFAERFHSNDSILLSGALLDVGSINSESHGGVFVGVFDPLNGFPGPLRFESWLSYSRIKNSGLVYVPFYPYVKLKGTYFISFSMTYEPDEIFSIRQSPWKPASENTTFIYVNNEWHPISSITPDHQGMSLNIKPVACVKMEEHEIAPQKIIAYPNPSRSLLVIPLPLRGRSLSSIQCFDNQGRLHDIKYETIATNVLLNTTTLSRGLYFCRVIVGGEISLIKFIKE